MLTQSVVGTVLALLCVLPTVDCTCSTGTTGPNGGPCIACAAGTYKDVAGSAECTACPLNSVSVEGSGNKGDCKCNAGMEVIFAAPAYQSAFLNASVSISSLSDANKSHWLSIWDNVG